METETTYRLIFLAALLIFAAVRVVYTRRAGLRSGRKSRSQEAGALHYLRMAVGLPGGLALLLWLVNPNWTAWCSLPLPVELRWLGAGLAAPALALLLWVHSALDTNFSPTLQLDSQHQLITSGPYRWVRHPMYTVLMLTGLSAFLLSANAVLAFVSIPGMVLAVALRIPHEEAMLLRRFGSRYSKYQQTSGLLLPRLSWRESKRWLRSNVY